MKNTCSDSNNTGSEFPKEILIKALKEIISESWIEKSIKASKEAQAENSPCPSEVSQSTKIFLALEQSYGSLASLGIAQRAGRGFFHHGMKQLPLFSSLRQTDFLLLPPPKKFKQGLEFLAETCALWFREGINISESNAEWQWAVNGSTLIQPHWLSWQKGLLYAAAYHFSQGKVHLIEEIKESSAPHQACLRISKQPLAY